MNPATQLLRRTGFLTRPDGLENPSYGSLFVAGLIPAPSGTVALTA